MSLKATYMKTFVADLSGLSVHDTDPLEDKLQMWRWETKISSRETHMNPFDSVKNTDSLAAESSVARKLKIVVPSMWGEKSVEGDGRQIQTPPVEITALVAVPRSPRFTKYDTVLCPKCQRYISLYKIQRAPLEYSIYSIRNSTTARLLALEPAAQLETEPVMPLIISDVTNNPPNQP